MSNETLSRILGATVGAAMIIAGLAVFGPRTSASAEGTTALRVVSAAASLHASETVNVFGGN